MIGLGLGINKTRVFASGGYTPADDTDLFDFWDAQVGITAISSELTNWEGVNSTNLAAPTVTSRPLYASETVNGLDVINFREADPNYISATIASLTTTVAVHFLIRMDDSLNTVFASDVSAGYIYGRDGSGTQADNGFGGAVEYFLNGVSLGTNISRSAVYAACSGSVNVFSMKNINMSTYGGIMIGDTAFLGRSFDGIYGDIILSGGDTFFTENVDFLMAKYAI